MVKQVMKRAHELVKCMEGDYRARMALALRQAWKETKAPKQVVNKKSKYPASKTQLKALSLLGIDANQFKGYKFGKVGYEEVAATLELYDIRVHGNEIEKGYFCEYAEQMIWEKVEQREAM